MTGDRIAKVKIDFCPLASVAGMCEIIHARNVADYFLANVDEASGDSISNLKLQKLVYFAQGLHLAMRDASLFGEPIEAWDHGPVVPGLYHDFKHRGNQSTKIQDP